MSIARFIWGLVVVGAVARLVRLARQVSAWPVAGTWAEHAANADWWRIASLRLALGAIGALLTAGALWVLNRAASRANMAAFSLRSVLVASGGGVAVACAAIAGVCYFIVTRPVVP